MVTALENSLVFLWLMDNDIEMADDKKNNCLNLISVIFTIKMRIHPYAVVILQTK